MAGIQADEEEDEGFGDFKFVTTTASTAAATAMSQNPAAASNRLSDDDWSDFVSFNGSPQIQSDPEPPASSNSLRPFDFFTDHATAQRSADMAPTGAVSEKSKWVKPSGAIPLSIFGEEEAEEDGSGVDDSSFNGAAGLFNHSNGDPVRKAPNLSSPVGLNDLIANLYNHNQSSTLNGGEQQELDSGIGLKAELNPKPISNGFNFDKGNGNGEHDDEDEWEFRVADAETRVNGENSEGNQDKAHISSDLSFNSFFPIWNGFSSDINGFTSKSNGLESSTNGFSSAGVKKQEDADDDFSWGFKVGEPENNSKEGNSKVNGNMRDIFEEVEPKFEFENVVPEPTGVNATSDKNSQMFGLDFTFESPVPGSRLTVLEDSNLTSIKTDVKINANPSLGSFGFDEDVWEFKEAASETSPCPSGQDEPVVVKNGTTVTYIGNSDAVLQNGVHFKEDPEVVDGFLLAPANGNMESTDNIWGFKDAFSDSNLKEERNAEIQVNGKEALALSTSDGGQLENNGSLIFPNFPTLPNDTSIVRRQSSNMSINDLITSLYDQAAPVASVADAQVLGEIGLGTLKVTPELEPENEVDDYDDSWDFQAAEMEKGDASQTSGSLVQKLSESILDSNQSGQESMVMNSVNSLDDSSWEFKDASSRFGYGDQGSLRSLAEPHQKFSANIEIDDLLEFYSKLKDELCLIALSHLNRTKEAQGSVSLPSEYATVDARNKEIQELYDGLDPDNSISEGPLIDLSMRVPHLKEFLPVLAEKLQALDAEYQLSTKLFVAEEDPSLLIDLLRHVSLMLRILRWGSIEEHSQYVSIWSELISLCNQELKHGALLWKQALEKDVRGQLLSKSEGKRYIIALGEIYRVVGVLGASIKLYKPWILTSSADFLATSVLLHECSLFWSSYGLEEALHSISDPLEFPYDGTVTALLESIKDVHNLDECQLQTSNFAKEEHICQMSLLTAGSVPGMKMIEWNGEEYFVKLVNLWANLVSHDPPDLPRIEIS